MSLKVKNARGVVFLVNLLKPRFLIVGKSYSLYNHRQALRPFLGQNKQTKEEKAKVKRRKKGREESVIIPLSYELSGILVIKYEW